MSIDFFTTPCTQPDAKCQSGEVVCKTTTTNKKFGICDVRPPTTTPAYLEFNDSNSWIAEVSNPTGNHVTFKAIDNCVPVYRSDETLESRCDGMLYYDKTLIFFELKDRASSGWLSKGREQLTNTIARFKENHEIDQWEDVKAFVCNKQRPLFNASSNEQVQRFKDDTNGLTLNVNRKIDIQ